MIDTLSLSRLPDHQQCQFDSRYRIVLVAAQRAKHLMQGTKRTMPSKFTKETSAALEEALQNRIEFLVGKEAFKAIKESKQLLEHDHDPSAREDTDPVSREIKKELSVYVDDSAKVGKQEVEE